MDYYRRYIGDYRRDTARLSLAEHGAYTMLMDEAYATEKPLPLDYAVLYRICGAFSAEEQVAVRAVADQFFPAANGGVRFQKQVTAQIKKGRDAIDAWAAGAGSTNAKRWPKRLPQRRATPRASPAASPSDSPPVSAGDPIAINQYPITSSSGTSTQETAKVKTLAATSPKPRRRAAAHEADGPLLEACRSTWIAYAVAYETRWGASPVRSAVANAHVKAFCQIVPLAEAPAVAAFFLAHNRGLYVSAHHDLALLRRDAHALRTEWVTSRPQTDTEARAGDRTAATYNAFSELINEAEERERKAAHD